MWKCVLSRIRRGNVERAFEPFFPDAIVAAIAYAHFSHMAKMDEICSC